MPTKSLIYCDQRSFGKVRNAHALKCLHRTWLPLWRSSAHLVSCSWFVWRAGRMPLCVSVCLLVCLSVIPPPLAIPSVLVSFTITSGSGFQLHLHSSGLKQHHCQPLIKFSACGVLGGGGSTNFRSCMKM